MNGVYIAHYKGEKKKTDYLMHYGVKGMKWHQHLKARFDRERYYHDLRNRNHSTIKSDGKLTGISNYKQYNLGIGTYHTGNATYTRSRKIGNTNVGSYSTGKFRKFTLNPNIKKKVSGYVSKAKSVAKTHINRGRKALSRLTKKRQSNIPKYRRTTFN